MAKRYYEKDGPLGNIQNKTVAIIGYGSQGHAHALNLRDSGVNVVVGLYPASKSIAQAAAAAAAVMTVGDDAKTADTAGLTEMTVSDAAKPADTTMILVSDHKQGALYKSEIAPHMQSGKTLVF